MPQPQRTKYRSRYNKRRQRRKRMIAILVAVSLVAIIVVVALLVSGGSGKKTPSASSAPSIAPEPSSLPPISVASSSEPAPSSSEPEPPPPPPPGPYDEAGIPPLYNATHAIPADVTAAILAEGGMIATGGERMQARAGQAFLDMRAAATAEGIDLAPVSGYRSNERQTINFNNAIQRNQNKGMTLEEAERETKRYYAIPGTSEHEAGLAMDIGWIEDSFESSPAFAWLQQNANSFGFIFRYRKETEAITGIAYEPWHYRFVGANHALEIEAKGVTLEEYVESLQN